MPFLAHTPNAKSQPHYLREHLQDVGELTAYFANELNPDWADAARWAGRLHDLGKYREEFQEYLLGHRQGSAETHHAVYGAGLSLCRGWVALAYAIAGHHAGLHDFDELRGFVKKPCYQMDKNLPPLIKKFEAELGSLPLKVSEPTFIQKNLQTDLYVRMIFSALVDADFLDTEAHFQAAPRRKVPALNQEFLATELLARLNVAKDKKALDAAKDGKNPKVIALRNAIYGQCLQAAEKEQGFFSLTVPTGGGKTLSGMAFALAHAARHRLRRVIVVIPYLSIIEQNAVEYRQILDPDQESFVIENHSAVVIPAEKQEESRSTETRSRSPLVLAAENWDAPVIITTAVQFIESLFSNKPSRCRKLHNIARSVVLFDEVQTLPVHLLEPLLSVWRELRDQYGVSFVFSTATQPAFRKQANLQNGFIESEVEEITADTEATFKQLCRVRFELPRAGEKRDWANIAAEMRADEQVLCVVNTRKQAFTLWQELSKRLPEIEHGGLFHLSSAMCAEHRLHVIGAVDAPREGSIRWRLEKGLPCRVVSTQLVEAGVDLDFPVLYRALGPLDSIVQAAGRCNRENRLTQLGRVIVFNPADESLPQGVYKTATEETAALLPSISGERLTTDSKELFACYFKRLYGKAATDYARPGETTIQQDRQALNFRSAASKVKVIEEGGISVVVPYGGDNGPAMKIVKEIRAKNRNSRALLFGRADLRRLQRYMVNVRKNDYEELQQRGQLTALVTQTDEKKGIELQVLNVASYHNDLGVLSNERPTNEILCG